MNWTGRTPVKFGPEITGEVRLLAFFGHLDCRIYLGKSYIDVGAGSFSAARKIINIPKDHVGPLGSIGRYVEAADCKILYAGEHQNDQPVNVVFMNTVAMWPVAAAAGLRSKTRGQINIGHDVVISEGAMVRSGVAIGDGAVLAAGAVVTKDVEPFTIVGGVPARKLKDRLVPGIAAQVAETRWWDFSIRYLMENASQIQQLAVTKGGHDYRPPRPRYVFAMDPTGARVVGFVDGAGEHSLADAPESARAYASQDFSKDAYWLADPWMI